MTSAAQESRVARGTITSRPAPEWAPWASSGRVRAGRSRGGAVGVATCVARPGGRGCGAYTIEWPAPGHPRLAARVQALLGAAGIPSGSDAGRGFDHGTFVPLQLTYPRADVPTIQLSLQRGLDPAEHLAIERALAPLRDEGIFIVGSGMSYHNLRAFFGGATAAATFDAWLGETIAQPPDARAQRLTRWSQAPAARAAQPREEHLLPRMVVVGAAGDDPGRLAYHGTMMGNRLSAYHFG